ncbi:MAG: hypothetical protein GY854_23540 [Deltaproteobacteria bacterium]|nr:hypothetical protein [Deltaproteobacteria bacterium]
MTIFNVLQFCVGDHVATESPNPSRALSWSGKTFALVQGGLGNDFAVYWQRTSEGWTPEQIASSGHKISASDMKGSELHFFMMQGLIQEMPETWHYRA